MPLGVLRALQNQHGNLGLMSPHWAASYGSPSASFLLFPLRCRGAGPAGSAGKQSTGERLPSRGASLLDGCGCVAQAQLRPHPRTPGDGGQLPHHLVNLSLHGKQRCNLPAPLQLSTAVCVFPFVPSNDSHAVVGGGSRPAKSAEVKDAVPT